MTSKKYKTRLVIDDIIDADNPREAKELLQGLVDDGFYGSKAYIRAKYMTARRRKDLEEGESRDD